MSQNRYKKPLWFLFGVKLFIFSTLRVTKLLHIIKASFEISSILVHGPWLRSRFFKVLSVARCVLVWVCAGVLVSWRATRTISARKESDITSMNVWVLLQKVLHSVEGSDFGIWNDNWRMIRNSYRNMEFRNDCTIWDLKIYLVINWKNKRSSTHFNYLRHIFIKKYPNMVE